MNIYFKNYDIKDNVLYLNNDYRSELFDCNVNDCFAIPINQILGISKSSYSCSTFINIYTSHFIFELSGENLKYCGNSLLFLLFKK